MSLKVTLMVALLVLFGEAVMAMIGYLLMQRKIMPNLLVGVRSEKTLADESVWYCVNEKAGRYFFYLGIVGTAVAILGLLLLAMGFDATKVFYLTTFTAIATGVSAVILAGLFSGCGPS